MTVPTVLAVDDSADDLTLLSIASTSAGVSFRFQSVQSGQDAIDYLLGCRGYGDRARFPFPEMVLLDLKMPGVSGFDVLSWLREHADLGRVPVVVFTSSVHPEDRQRALALGASGYAVKPVSYDALQRLMADIDRLLTSNVSPDFSALETHDNWSAVGSGI